MKKEVTLDFLNEEKLRPEIQQSKRVMNIKTEREREREAEEDK